MNQSTVGQTSFTPSSTRSLRKDSTVDDTLQKKIKKEHSLPVIFPNVEQQIQYEENEKNKFYTIVEEETKHETENSDSNNGIYNTMSKRQWTDTSKVEHLTTIDYVGYDSDGFVLDFDVDEVANPEEGDQISILEYYLISPLYFVPVKTATQYLVKALCRRTKFKDFEVQPNYVAFKFTAKDLEIRIGFCGHHILFADEYIVSWGIRWKINSWITDFTMSEVKIHENDVDLGESFSGYLNPSVTLFIKQFIRRIHLTPNQDMDVVKRGYSWVVFSY